MKITIETIPHEKQRYPTVGDWQFTPDGIIIRVSQMSDPRYEMLVAVHELVEILICKEKAITEAAVDAFDIAYEKARAEGDVSEPGDDPMCPYAGPHCVATGIERVLAAELGVNWKTYETEVESL